MRASILLVPLVLGCSGDPAAPPASVALPEGAQAAKGSGKGASPTVAIDDALNRLVPALDAETAEELKGPLTAIKAALKGSDGSALEAAATVAEAALSRALARNDEYIADLTAISLALDAATQK